MSGGGEPLLEARGVGRRAPGDGAWLLRDVDLAIARGERVAVAGPSGAGKTLLLRALALLDPVDAGEILWEGEAVPDDRVPAFRRSAVYLHQRPALFEGSVRDNLRAVFDLDANGERAYDEDVAVASLERLGRGAAFLDKPADDLSGGEEQIVAFLRAIQLDPAVMLLDEPTAALDREATGSIERLVAEWADERPDERGFVWVSHDPSQADRVAERTVRLRSGSLAP